ncbi:hypothetical protein NCCP2331_01560 [Sporosarcina sp. NCCP-2331]|nr:hypothetical protein NCCP2331_01560 [Sporosarcina sp. NCCP-2331]GLB54784.1 hypothetical protein NCCP2378_05690 [Sporosarcina sp. NCCP-2378]
MNSSFGSFVKLFGAVKQPKRAFAAMFGSFPAVFGAVTDDFRAPTLSFSRKSYFFNNK